MSQVGTAELKIEAQGVPVRESSIESESMESNPVKQVHLKGIESISPKPPYDWVALGLNRFHLSFVIWSR